MSNELSCTWQEFKTRAKEFNKAAPGLNSEELESAWHCIALSYLNMSEPMWLSSAAILLNMEGEVYTKRLLELEKSN